MNMLGVQDSTAEEFYSRDGYLIRFHDERWKLSKDIVIPVSAVAGALTAHMYDSYRHVLAFYAKTGSASHVLNICSRSKHYFESTTALVPFSVESLISYRSTLDAKTEWYMGVLRGFIRKWADLGYVGIPSESLSLLSNWTLKGNEKGYAVQSMSPDSGPLTDIEIEGVIAAVVSAYIDERLALVDTCYAMTLAMTGRRRGQISALKLKDLVQQQHKNGVRYFIDFPRAKQRNQVWRQTFNRFSIVEDLWLLLQQQAVSVRHAFSGKLGSDVPHDLVSELPLFPILKAVGPLSGLKDQLKGDLLHAPSNAVKVAMDRVEKTINVISERTGLPVHLNAIRFRYTLGTNLAREGKGEYVIAEALDHSDTQNAGVYVRNIPEIVERIDKAVALQLAPIAQAFQGVLVVSESDARRGRDRSSRISNGAANLGTCGSYGFCGALAPIACYTCNHFQPWLDGPHEAVLDRLILERDSVLEQTADRRIASVNDRLILAVSDVVNRCSAMKKEVFHE
ncbi:phage integrase family protein [Pseudomonas sp. DD1]|uniref:site-specific integrase n=1 Tax=Pseudomonas TaxID=286 RepID=UPI002B1DC453|nr:site-specific integrase [Pseudomonas rhodesiae]